MTGRLQMDLGIADYHRSKAISNSGLGAMAESPAHYYAKFLDPNRPPHKESPDQLHGHLAHCAILEPDQFDVRYHVGPDVSRATKEWKSFAEKLPFGVTGIKPEQREIAMLQAQNVGLLPDIANALASGVAEESAFFIDEDTEVECRVRPDFRHHVVDDRGVILLDVKTFGSADPWQFARQAARMKYHRQAAFYTDGYQAASGRPVYGFVFIVVENVWPFAASAVQLDEEALDQGRAEYRSLLNLYATCKERGDWPAFGDVVHTVSLPRYAITA